MERRYELFAHAGARDLTRYNTIVSEREIPEKHYLISLLSLTS